MSFLFLVVSVGYAFLIFRHGTLLFSVMYLNICIWDIYENCKIFVYFIILEEMCVK